MSRFITHSIDRRLFETPPGFLRNPTAWLFAVDIVVFFASCYLGLRGLIGPGAGFAISLLCLYCFYTVAHEACHGNAHDNRACNLWMGRVSSGLQGLTFPLFRITHLQHHAHTNDPECDPDFVIGRQPRWLLPVWTIVRLSHDNQFMIRRGLWSGRPALLREHIVTVSLQVAVVAAFAAAGRLDFILWFWLAPALAAGALLELSVAWLVHYPHTSRHPLENTRMFPGYWLQLLMLNQNFHLVHHLWPRIPWFRYREAAELADVAVADHRAACASAEHADGLATDTIGHDTARQSDARQDRLASRSQID